MIPASAATMCAIRCCRRWPGLRPGRAANILRTAQIMAGEDDYMQQQAALAWDTMATVREGAVTVDLAGWQSLHIAMQRRIAARGVEERHRQL